MCDPPVPSPVLSMLKMTPPHGLKRQHSNKSAKGKRGLADAGDADLTGLDGSLPDYMSLPDDQGARLDDVEDVLTRHEALLAEAEEDEEDEEDEDEDPEDEEEEDEDDDTPCVSSVRAQCPR